MARPKKEPRCGAVVEWLQLCGMLTITEGYYTGRCPVSRREIRQKKQPKLGAKCGLPASMCSRKAPSHE